MYTAGTAHASSSYPSVPNPPQRYYQQPVHSQHAHPASHIPRTPGMDPGIYATGHPSPPSPFSPRTPNHGSAIPPAAYPSLSSSLPNRGQYFATEYSQQYEPLPSSSPALLSAPVPSKIDDHVKIQELSPYEGAQGTQLTMKCDVTFPATPPGSDSGGSPGARHQARGRALRVVFGSHPVQTQVMVLGSAGLHGSQTCQLNATVPSWSSTGAGSMGRGNRAPVYVQVLDGNHAIVQTVHAGEFSYSTTGSKGTYAPYSPVASSPLKRSGDSLESSRSSPRQFMNRRVVSGGKYDPPVDSNPYPVLQPPYSPNPNANDFSPQYPHSTPTMPSQPPADQYSPTPSQPNLMRATQIQQPTITIPVAGPYPMSGSTKARLELTGDLDAMSKGWSQEEWMNRRRLVQFWRRQEGTTIYGAFRPLSQQGYPQAQQSIIISCIFREDKNECFVTSVDAIYLLEALVGTRFTVEEKNRIRRNLEGFRPITVSKSKAGSEEFFKLIMGFPNPKPRNIEKDVKVFPWSILGHALKKIIGKYSATYPYNSPPLSLPPSAPPQPTSQPYSHPSMPGPLPLQDGYANASVISGSVPTLVSHSSSDSSTYNSDSYAQAVPETPQTGSIPSVGESPSQYHSSSHSTQLGPSEKFSQHGPPEFVSFSPQASPYIDQGGPDYWGGEAPAVASYGMPGGGGFYDQPPQLPHMHETLSRHPSANDLRVVYPSVAQ